MRKTCLLFITQDTLVCVMKKKPLGEKHTIKNSRGVTFLLKYNMATEKLMYCKSIVHWIFTNQTIYVTSTQLNRKNVTSCPKGALRLHPNHYLIPPPTSLLPLHRVEASFKIHKICFYSSTFSPLTQSPGECSKQRPRRCPWVLLCVKHNTTRDSLPPPLLQISASRQRLHMAASSGVIGTCIEMGGDPEWLCLVLAAAIGTLNAGDFSFLQSMVVCISQNQTSEIDATPVE